MRPNEAAQFLRHGEGDEEVRRGQKQSGLLALQPVVGVGLTALRAVAVVAGMIAVGEAWTVGALVHFAAQGRGAARQDLVQNLSMPPRHGGAKTLQILRRQLAEQLMNSQAGTTVTGGRAHQRSPMKSS